MDNTTSDLDKIREAKKKFIQTYPKEKYGHYSIGISHTSVVVNFSQDYSEDIPNEIDGIKIEKRVIKSIRPHPGVK